MTQVPQIDIHQAKELLDTKAGAFVDIRDPNSYAQAHIPGAEHLSDTNIAEFLAAADKTKPLVVYCYHGNASRGGAAYFLNQGFTEVVSMAGGFEAWRMQYEIGTPEK